MVRKKNENKQKSDVKENSGFFLINWRKFNSYFSKVLINFKNKIFSEKSLKPYTNLLLPFSLIWNEKWKLSEC